MRAPWSRLTRRSVTLGGVAAASAAFATVAMAAGPVIYSEYTSSDDGSDRENRVVEGDGTNDAPFAKDAYAATVSPDGRRIAQIVIQRVPLPGGDADDRPYRSLLRVTAADGSSPVELSARTIDAAATSGRIVAGRPVWSPDGTQVLVEDRDLADEDGTTTDRLLCTVATKTCRTVGKRRYPDTLGNGDSLTTDIVAWPAGTGPLREALGPYRSAPSRPSAACGARAVTTPGPERRIGALYRPNTFGAVARLRGLPLDSSGAVDPQTADLVGVRDGVVAVDAPAARYRQGRVRCNRRTRTWNLSTSLGLPRLTVRRAGVTTTLPTPAGLRRGDLTALVATDDGGAILVTRDVATARKQIAECPRRGRTTARCSVFSSSSGFDDAGPKARRTRVWRYTPGASSLRPLTGLRRSAFASLRDADEIAQGDGDALLAVDDDGIDRVPLNGDAPTVVARGEGITLGLSEPDDDE